MPSLHLYPDVEERGGMDLLKGIAPEEIVHLSDETVVEMGALRSGMASGKPSVAVALKLPDGKVLVWETSLELMEAGVRAMRAAME